jgi:hypothetical protein
MPTELTADRVFEVAESMAKQPTKLPWQPKVEGLGISGVCEVLNALTKKYNHVRGYSESHENHLSVCYPSNCRVTEAGLETNANCTGYRLPLEEEWERFARGSSGLEDEPYSDFPVSLEVGADESRRVRELARIAWYGRNSFAFGGSPQPGKPSPCATQMHPLLASSWVHCEPRPVALKEPVGGLYDVLGNVAELTASNYTAGHDKMPVQRKPEFRKGGESEYFLVAKGNSYSNALENVSVYDRVRVDPADLKSYGVRAVRLQGKSGCNAGPPSR